MLNDAKANSYKALIVDYAQELAIDRHPHVSMFAVIKPNGKTPVELRFVEVDKDDGTETFDKTLISSGFSEYLNNETRYTTFEKSLDLKSSVGVLTLDEIEAVLSEENADAVAEFPIVRFIRIISSAQHDYLQNSIAPLDEVEVANTIGLVFSYSCVTKPNEIVYAYQKVPPSSALKSSSFIYKLKGGARFCLFTEESIKIGSRFDFLVKDNVIFASKPSTIVSQFGYGQVLQNHAGKVIDQLDHLVSGADIIAARVTDNKVRTINKLLKIQHSPVLRMQPSQLRQRLETIDVYKGKFRFDEHNCIIVDTKRVEELLRMLDDGILKSPLTNEIYESEIKSVYTGKA